MQHKLLYYTYKLSLWWVEKSFDQCFYFTSKRWPEF
jgi:hypothetical protein